MRVNYSKPTTCLLGLFNQARGSREGIVTSGWVKPHHLYKQVLDNRERYKPELEQLYQAGFIDPLEEIDEITTWVERKIGRAKLPNQLATALRLFRLIIPSYKFFIFKGKTYWGCKNGLEIEYCKDRENKVRQRDGALLPRDIFNLPKAERVAMCMEYSPLIVIILRAAKIEAWIHQEEKHVYVVANLDGTRYKIDAGISTGYELKFEETNKPLNNTLATITMYYYSRGLFFRYKGENDRAIETFKTGIEINPHDYKLWSGLGIMFRNNGQAHEAMHACTMATMLEPESATSWHNLGLIYQDQGDIPQAELAYRRALQLDGTLDVSRKNLSLAFANNHRS